MGDFSQYIGRLLLGWRLVILAVIAVDFLSPEHAIPSLQDAKPLVSVLTPTITFVAVAMWMFISTGLTFIMSVKERAAILAIGDLAVAALAVIGMPKSLAAILLFSLPALDLSTMGVGAVAAGGVVSAVLYPVLLAASGHAGTIKDVSWYLAVIVMSVTCGLIMQVQQRQQAQAEAVLSVIRTSQELGTSASLDKILTVAMRDIKQLFECSTCVIYLRDGNDADSTFLRVARAETPKEKVFIEFDMEQKKSVIGEVMETKSASLIEDFQAYPNEEVIRRDPMFRATLVSPLLFETHALGALFVSHHQPGTYQVGMLHLLTLLANQLGVAVRNVHLQRTTETLAITDSLSGLYTHGHFQSSLDSELKEAKYTTKQPLSLLILDLDFFKKVNDTYGHPQGDALLKQLGGIIKRIARPTDIVCRYGGDEFTMIMPNTPHDEAALIAEKVRVAVEEYDFALGRQLVHVTLSGGVATFPEGGVDKLELISNADQAMYRAKQSGRNCIVKQGSGRKRFEAVGGRTTVVEAEGDGGGRSERPRRPAPPADDVETAAPERPRRPGVGVDDTAAERPRRPGVGVDDTAAERPRRPGVEVDDSAAERPRRPGVGLDDSELAGGGTRPRRVISPGPRPTVAPTEPPPPEPGPAS